MISLRQQIVCVEREIAMRKAVYPGRVRQKKMQLASANYELAAMEAVLATLKEIETQLMRAADGLPDSE